MPEKLCLACCFCLFIVALFLNQVWRHEMCILFQTTLCCLEKKWKSTVNALQNDLWKCQLDLGTNRKSCNRRKRWRKLPRVLFFSFIREQSESFFFFVFLMPAVSILTWKHKLQHAPHKQMISVLPVVWALHQIRLVKVWSAFPLSA